MHPSHLFEHCRLSSSFGPWNWVLGESGKEIRLPANPVVKISLKKSDRSWKPLWLASFGKTKLPEEGPHEPQRPPTNPVATQSNCIKSNGIIVPHCLLFVAGSKNRCYLQWIHHPRWKAHDNLIFLVTKSMRKPSWEGKQRAEILRLRYRFIDPWNTISLVKFLLSFCIPSI